MRVFELRIECAVTFFPRNHGVEVLPQFGSVMALRCPHSAAHNGFATSVLGNHRDEGGSVPAQVDVEYLHGSLAIHSVLAECFLIDSEPFDELKRYLFRDCVELCRAGLPHPVCAAQNWVCALIGSVRLPN
jgi:hypothetical protein